MNERLTELTLQIRCEYCLAGAWVWCRTRTGAKATMLHSRRSDPIRLAWLYGLDEGYKDGLERGKVLAEERRELESA